jgi:hypothetical protein
MLDLPSWVGDYSVTTSRFLNVVAPNAGPESARTGESKVKHGLGSEVADGIVTVHT